MFLTRVLRTNIFAAILMVVPFGVAGRPVKTEPPPELLTKPLTQDQIDKVYCLPGITATLATVWQMAQDGQAEYEAAFIVSHLGNVYIEPMEKGRVHAQTVFIFDNTVAIFHVHPNSCIDDNPRCLWPSTPDDNYEHNGMGDTGLADKFKIDIYVISKAGLTRYRPGVGNSEVAVGGEWLTGKECK